MLFSLITPKKPDFHIMKLRLDLFHNKSQCFVLKPFTLLSDLQCFHGDGVTHGETGWSSAAALRAKLHRIRDRYKHCLL